MPNIRTSIIFSFLGQYATQVITFVSIILIARLLTPEELGIYAVAVSITLIASELKSFGLGGYLIRAKEIDRQLVSSVLGVSVLICGGLALIIISISYFVGEFYNQSSLPVLLILMSLTFLFAPHIGIGKSLMTRDFRFKELMVINVITQTSGLAITVSLIYLDFSYYSLAISAVITNLLELILVIAIKNKDFVFIPKFDRFKELAKFGLFITSANVLRKFSLSLPDLIIGKIGTLAQVAYTSRAIGFLEFSSSILINGARSVVTPLLADKNRKNEDVAHSFYQATNLLTSITIPVLLVCGVASSPVILTFFGAQWQVSIELVSILSVWAAIKSCHALSPSLIITLKKEKPLFFKELLVFSLYAMAAYVGYQQHSLIGVAYGFVIVAVIELLLVIMMFKFILQFKVFNYIKLLGINTLNGLGCAASAYLVVNYLFDSTSANWLILISLAPIMLSFWLLFCLLTRAPIAYEIKRLIFNIK